MSRNVEAIYPLSPLQEGMLFHSLYDRESRLYSEQLSWIARGQFDVAAFERAWQHVVDRHGVLRTSFVWEQQKKPLQIVRQKAPLAWVREDWRDVPEAEHDARRTAFLAADRARGFDLSKAPPIRLSVATLTDTSWLIVFSFHHILLDGWSLALIFKEVTAAYLAFSRGETPQLPPSRPYREYIKWLQQQDAAAAEAFWREALAGISGPTPLPEDRRLADQDVAGHAASLDQHTAKLSPEMTAALSAVGRRHQLTLNTIVQGAWALLLGRYTGQRDVVVGATVSGRPSALAGVDSMVGMFINTLPLRVTIADDEPLVTWLGRLQDRQAEMRQFEYSALVDVRRWSGVHASLPLFENIVVFENYPTEPQDPSVASSHRVEQFRFSETTNFPLTLTVAPGAQLLLRINYDGRRFERATIERLTNHFLAGLTSIARVPEQKVRDVAFLPGVERERLREWNVASTRTVDVTRPVHELIAERAALAPDAVAIRFDDAAVTYRELQARADAIAAVLHARGIGRGACVGLFVDRSPAMVAAALGILRAGAAYVPLDPTYPAERIAFMLGDARVAAVITERMLAGALPPHGGAVICVEDIAAGGDAPTVRVGPLDAAYMIYTSGSTGTPKGVQVPHRALVNFLASMREQPGLEARDRLLAVTTLSFDIAGLELFLPLTTGAEIILAGREAAADGRRLAALISDRDVTVMQATPATWRLLLEAGWAPRPGLRMFCGGEALPRELAMRLTANGGVLWNLYGPTETTIWSTAHRVGGDERAIRIGRPIANTQVHVLDSQLRPVAVGFAGELFIGGLGVARGYWNRPDLTAERFLPDPFSSVPGARMYRTGDAARYLGDGTLECLGRLDHQVKVRGYRIELGEIESVLGECDGVRQAVAVVREDVPGDPRIVAYIAADEGRAVATADLRTRVAAKLPRYMHPSAFVTLDAMPLTPNGKIDRGALPAPDGDRDQSVAFVAPQGELQERIAKIWADVLRVERVGSTDNFFDLGGHSLLLLRVHGRLVEDGIGPDLSLTDLFQYPTVAALARRLGGEPEEEAWARRVRARAGRKPAADAIAIVGMAARFPGAADVESFWNNIRNGVESIRFFTDDELRAEGVPEHFLRNERYVRARGALDDVDRFDAHFFGYTPREAELIDPQQRIFLECAWEALEAAGYDAERHDGAIAVYAGSAVNTYVANLYSRPDLLAAAAGTQFLISSSTEYLPSRTSYKLNLRGPSVNVQAACATSLVAVHHACRSLLEGEADMALAGGVAVFVPMNGGYLYQEGGIHSPDGHCRAFDAAAGGTVPGCGVGVVVLKRLGDAVAAGDHIHAVIRGTAVNNDGSAKVGYTAPSVEGEAEVIALALAAAGVESSSIGYVEGHGTATVLGDPIEVTALTKAFGAAPRRGKCALGAVKTNVGHLDAAAGVAGLIKATLALERGVIPPTLHFERPNPEIHFDRTPFYVNTSAVDWPAGDLPRRAGVNAYGIGGTNVHAVLEEAPRLPASGPSRPAHAIVLSAKTPSALEAATDRLLEYLEAQPSQNIADVAYTLQAGRKAFPHRRALVAASRDDIVAALASRDPKRVASGVAAGVPPWVFAFTGQGSQYLRMGAGLYEHEPVFRKHLDACCDLLTPLLGRDLRELLYASDAGAADAAALLRQTAFAQPALFATEYALAQAWISWGVEPDAMIGHSLGEYVAACLADVLSLEDALALVVARARLMQAQPAGAMLAVSLPESEVQRRLPRELSIAAVNAPDVTVVSGGAEAIEAFASALAEDRVPAQSLRTSHAFHSAMMEAALEPFAAEVRKVRLKAPRRRYISNVTGTWVTAADATDPRYWARHMRQAVRFGEGLDTVLQDPAAVILEVGPGDALASLARRHSSRPSKGRVVTSLRRDHQEIDDYAFLLRAASQLWIAGARLDWDAVHSGERRHRLQLPTYPFERQSYWVKPAGRARDGAAAGTMSKRPDVKDWFYLPAWRRTLSRPATGSADEVLVFADAAGVGARVAQRLRAEGRPVATVRMGRAFARIDRDTYELAPGDDAGYAALLDALAAEGRTPRRIAHLWSIDAPRAIDGLDSFDRTQEAGLFSLLALARALAPRLPGAPIDLIVAGTGVMDTGAEPIVPARRTILGACTVIPQELDGVRCTCVDVDGAAEPAAAAIAAEIAAGPVDPVVAWRGTQRFVQSFEPVVLNGAAGASVIRDRGVYLITGGLGQIGLTIAGWLARDHRARLCLVSRSADRVRLEVEGARAGGATPERGAARVVLDLLAAGADVELVSADVADAAALARAVERAVARFGRLDGVVHAAGLLGESAFKRIETMTRADVEALFDAKVHGVNALHAALDGRPLDFVLLASSIATVLGGLGYSAYAAANHYLDAFAHARNREAGPRWLALGWDGWNFGESSARSALLDLAMLPGEGLETFRRAVSCPELTRVVVSTADLDARLDRYVRQREVQPPAGDTQARYARPAVAAAFVAPADEVDRTIASIWEELLGLEQVGIDDDFFELGGHSLLANRVVTRMKEHFQVNLPLRIMFEAPTVAALGERIRQTQWMARGREPMLAGAAHREEIDL